MAAPSLPARIPRPQHIRPGALRQRIIVFRRERMDSWDNSRRYRETGFSQ